MIYIFRRLRRAMLSDNKYRKYALYALGEIALVVFGILIALQINNWNEGNKEEHKQRYYLQSLKSDLEANRAELDKVINICRTTISVADSLILISERSLDNVDIKVLTNQILNSITYSIFINKSATIKELMATGDLKIIKDDSLRSYLANWESEIEDIRSYELPNKENSRSHAKLVMQHLDVYKHRLDKPALNLHMASQLFANREFMNSLEGRAAYPKWLETEYHKQKDRTKVLLRLIDQELKSL